MNFETVVNWAVDRQGCRNGHLLWSFVLRLVPTRFGGTMWIWLLCVSVEWANLSFSRSNWRHQFFIISMGLNCTAIIMIMIVAIRCRIHVCGLWAGESERGGRKMPIIKSTQADTWLQTICSLWATHSVSSSCQSSPGCGGAMCRIWILGNYSAMFLCLQMLTAINQSAARRGLSSWRHWSVSIQPQFRSLSSETFSILSVFVF